MKILKFSSDCGYSETLELGTPDMDQTLTDVNTEFSEFRLFRCPAENALMSMDILDAGFSGRCSSDSAELVPLEDVTAVPCPRCGKILSVQELRPLSAESS